MTTVCIDLDVHDPEALYQQAFRHATEVDKLSPAQADEMLKPDGRISVSDCLVMVFDPGSLPGVSINQTTVDN